MKFSEGDQIAYLDGNGLPIWVGTLIKVDGQYLTVEYHYIQEGLQVGPQDGKVIWTTGYIQDLLNIRIIKYTPGFLSWCEDGVS